MSPGRRRALVNWWRAYRAWIVVFVLAVVLGATGLAGAGRQHPLRGERYDARHITITPAGGTGVRVREVVDIDFGRVARHGYRLQIPGDLGTPTDVRASSPSANADVHIEQLRGGGVDIRIGDPLETFRGQHRYVVSYTYPLALDGTDSLALDIVSPDDPLDSGRLEVVVSGFSFDATFCDVGRRYTHGGCELTRQANGTYRTVIEPLDREDGVTIAGDGFTITDAVDVTLPALPDRPPSFPRWMGAVLGAAALVPVGLLWLFARWYGTNRVARGGPTEAAFADERGGAAGLSPPPAGEPRNDLPTYRVPDSRLAELATIEFAPPAGLRPWQGVLAVNEHIDHRSVTAWFSGLIAAEALTVESGGYGSVRLGRGPRLDTVDDADRRIVERLLADRDTVTLAGSDPRAVAAWYSVMDLQARFARQSGWWRRNPPGAAGRPTGSLRINPYWISIVAVHVFVIGLVLLRGHFWTVLGALLRAPFVVISPPALAIVLTAGLAGWAYLGASRQRWPARSATGSAAALRTLSFQRFLDRSEGQHVEWAWERGVLREYSAWAVALGASDAWGRAIEATELPSGVELSGSLDAALDQWGQLGRAFADLDLGAHDRRRREPYDNPWPRYLQSVGKAMASGGGGSGGSSGSSSRSSGSRGVGGGGGGGSRSSW